jgi:hypothetical protein
MSQFISSKAAYKLPPVLEALIDADPSEKLLELFGYSGHGNIVSNVSEIVRYVIDHPDDFPQFSPGGKDYEKFENARKCKF